MRPGCTEVRFGLVSGVELEGKTAVVTGASSGFGAATVRKLREAGARVVGGARRVERIDADLALPLDVTDEESCAAFVTRAAAELGGIDILYNNAGLALGRVPFTESTPEDEATVLHTNVDGAIRITRLALPHIRDGGHILFTGSIAGRQAYQNAAVYVAAKFALRGFVYALREDLLGRPIRITTVDPGLAQTEFSLVRFKGDEEAAKAPYEGVEPLTADDVADCVLFALTRPLHVNIDEMVIKALAQSSGGRIVRRETEYAHDPRRIDLLHLRRPRGHRGGHERVLRARHALPLAARAAGSAGRRRCCSRRAASSTSRPRSTFATARRTACRATRSRSRASASSAPACRSGSRFATRAPNRSSSTSLSRPSPTSRTSSR